MLIIVAATLLGWGLGANDAANAFGTAVSSGMVRWRTAAWLSACCILLGAGLQGAGGVHTLSTLTAPEMGSAGNAAAAAALTLALMTVLRLPVSSSQAVVGALVGMGLAHGQLNVHGLGKVVICWIGTPLGGMLTAAVFYRTLRWLFRRTRASVFVLDPLLQAGLVVCGCYGAYALGANNVANVATFFAADGNLSPETAVLLGGACIALGVLTYSRGVMLTVGQGVTPLDAFSALVVVLSQAVTVHVYALVGVPVSTSQAVIGAVVGIGLIKGVQIINLAVLGRIAAGWLATPLLAGAFGYIIALLRGT